MSPDDIRSIFTLAANRASRFRISLPEWPHRPKQSYAACVEDFDGPLPEDAVNAIATLEELAEKAEKGLQMSTGIFQWLCPTNRNEARAETT